MGCEDLFILDTNDVDLETLVSVLAMNMEEYDWEDPEDRNELLYGDFGALHLLNQVIKFAGNDPELRIKLRESAFRPLLKKLRLQIKKCSSTKTEEKNSMIELFGLLSQLRWTLEWGGFKQRIPELKCFDQDSLVGEFGFESLCFADCIFFPRTETGTSDHTQICQFWVPPDYWGIETETLMWEDIEKILNVKIKVKN